MRCVFCVTLCVLLGVWCVVCVACCVCFVLSVVCDELSVVCCMLCVVCCQVCVLRGLCCVCVCVCCVVCGERSVLYIVSCVFCAAFCSKGTRTEQQESPEGILLTIRCHLGDVHPSHGVTPRMSGEALHTTRPRSFARFSCGLPPLRKGYPGQALTGSILVWPYPAIPMEQPRHLDQ